MTAGQGDARAASEGAAIDAIPKHGLYLDLHERPEGGATIAWWFNGQPMNSKYYTREQYDLLRQHFTREQEAELAALRPLGAAAARYAEAKSTEEAALAAIGAATDRGERERRLIAHHQAVWATDAASQALALEARAFARATPGGEG